METLPVTKLTLSFDVEIDLVYDSFKGRTAEHLAEGIQDELNNLLFEISPNVIGVFTTLTSTKTND